MFEIVDSDGIGVIPRAKMEEFLSSTGIIVTGDELGHAFSLLDQEERSSSELDYLEFANVVHMVLKSDESVNICRLFVAFVEHAFGKEEVDVDLIPGIVEAFLHGDTEGRIQIAESMTPHSGSLIQRVQEGAAAAIHRRNPHLQQQGQTVSWREFLSVCLECMPEISLSARQALIRQKLTTPSTSPPVMTRFLMLPSPNKLTPP